MMKLISDNTYGELFEIAAARGIGLEINGSVEEPECYRMFGIAKECGCKFYFGSDAHHPNVFDTSKKGFEYIVDLLKLEEDDKFTVKK